MLRPVLFSSASVLIFLVAGCGSGSGGGSGGGNNGSGGGTTTNNAPTLTSIAPSITVVGAPAIAIDVYGSDFASGAVAEWNGNELNTTWISATELNANVPASDFASAGTAKVTVINGSITDPMSNALPFTIATPPAASTTWVRTVPGITDPADMVWDSVHGKLYVSVGSTDPAIPNTVVPVDPVAGTAGTPVAAGSNPHLLALSSDSSYLWVGLDGSTSVQRFLVPGLTKDISFTLPEAASSLQAAPVSPHTLALLRGAGEGVYVYDDATRRPSSVPTFLAGGPNVDWIQWGKDDSTIYGIANFHGVFPFQVSTSGASWNGAGGGVGLDVETSSFDSSNGLLYSVGQILDPVQNTQVGQFDVPLPDTACTADNSLARYYCMTTYSNSGTDVYLNELWVFDLNTHALLDRVKFGSVIGSNSTQSVSSITGTPWRLRRWGNAGLALFTIGGAPYGNGGIFLIDGAVVNPNVAADVSSGSSPASYSSLTSISPQGASAGSQDVTVTITGTNFTAESAANCDTCNYLQTQLPTSYVSPTQLNITIPASLMTSPGPLAINIFDPSTGLFSNTGLTFTVYPASGSTQMTALNLVGYAMAWDATHQLLYVGTADVDSAHPNSIVALSGENGTIAQVQPVSADPNILSVSAGAQYLYATFAGTTTMTQLQLPGLNSPLTWSLNNSVSPGAFFAGDMKAAPVSPNTTAVTFFKPGSPTATGGVGIYDNGTLRPNILPGWVMQGNTGQLYDTLAWGNSDSVLGSAENDNFGELPFYALAVDSSGASYLKSLASFNEMSDELQSDFGTGMIYSDDGNVANPVSATRIGSYNASGLVVPDSTLNRTFILGQTTSQANTNNFTIQSFDEKAFTVVSSITIDNLFGSPIAMVRYGASGLAVLTLNESGNGTVEPFGMLYLLQDTKFVSNAQLISSSPEREQELVQRRWKRISKSDILKVVQRRQSGELH